MKDSQHVVLDHEVLQGVDFSGRTLKQFASIDSKLSGCRFDRSRIQDGSFGEGRGPSEYVDCSFDGARIRFGPGGYARFVQCSFRDVDLRDWFCFAVELVDCTFSGHLRKAVFNGTVPEDKQGIAGRRRNEFHGNDFSEMELRDVAFRSGIDLTEQILPSGPEYLYLPEAQDAIRHARAQALRWEDLDRRKPAVALIEALEYELTDGQRQLLIRCDDYSNLRKEAVDAVFTLLRAG